MKHTFHLIFRLWKFLSADVRRRIGLAGVYMILAAFFDVITLAWLVPYSRVVTDPSFQSKLVSYSHLVDIQAALMLPTRLTAVFIVSVGVSITAIVSAKIRLYSVKYSANTAAIISNHVSVMSYERILCRDYESTILLNSSELIANLGYIGPVTGGVVLPLLGACSSAILIMMMSATLLTLNPSITAFAALGVTVVYAVTLTNNRRKMLYLASQAGNASQRWIQIQQESFNSARDIILDSSQVVYTTEYMKVDKKLRDLGARASILAASPRYYIETGSIIIIVAMTSILIIQGSEQSALTFIAIFFVAFQKILPAAQQMYSALSSTISHQHALLGIEKLLTLSSGVHVKTQMKTSMFPEIPNNFTLLLNNICYSYQKNQKVLTRCTLKINSGDIIAITGPSGTGKSTLMDIIMGLRRPHSGYISINDTTVYDSDRGIDQRYSWMMNISHVPQQVFITDSTLLHNVLFGKDLEHPDIELVKVCLEAACLSDYYRLNKNSLNELLGENGSRLSGGQKQRVGIARALYRQPKILFLDEATSALDEATEKFILRNILNMSQVRAIVMVTHRASSLELCNRVVRLRDIQEL
jgi:ABC-type multidrug transport system fused ATPase/permease subunit